MQEASNKISIIREKIGIFLQARPVFKEEYEVVYLMVEIRKILESREISTYQALRFYCNWAVHIRLTRSEFILNTLKKGINCKESGKEIAQKMKLNNPSLFKLSTLKSELDSFLSYYNLPKKCLSKDNWVKWMRLFLETIKEVSVISKSGVISRMDLIEKEGNYFYKFKIINNRDRPVIKLKFK